MKRPVFVYHHIHCLWTKIPSGTWLEKEFDSDCQALSGNEAHVEYSEPSNPVGP